MSLLLVLLVLLTAQALQPFPTNDGMAGVNRMFCEQIWLDLANVFPGSGVVLSFRDGMRNDGSTTLGVAISGAGLVALAGLHRLGWLWTGLTWPLRNASWSC